jgi:hypothetical protein
MLLTEHIKQMEGDSDAWFRSICSRFKELGFKVRNAFSALALVACAQFAVLQLRVFVCLPVQYNGHIVPMLASIKKKLPGIDARIEPLFASIATARA